MKKGILMASAIVFMALFVTSCKDSKNEEVEENEEKVFTIKDSPEYAAYGLPKYGLVGDVATQTKTVYSATWNNENSTIKVGDLQRQEKMTFDHNGFITGTTRYDVIPVQVGQQPVQRIDYATTYRYDDSYRLTQFACQRYNTENGNKIIKEELRVLYAYNDDAKEVEVFIFKKNESGAFVADQKKVCPLDANGRLDEEAVSHINYFAPKGEKASTGRNMRAAGVDMSQVYELEYFVSKDKKGNPVLTYTYGRETYAELSAPNDFKIIYDFTKSEITYHDGTVSAVDKSEQSIVGGDFVAVKAGDWKLKGNVKSLISRSYPESEWNENNQSVAKGFEAYKSISNFDAKGILVSFEDYRLDKGELKLDSKMAYKYDSKFRLTERTHISYYVDYGTDHVRTTRQVATYNDANKTAKIKYYSKLGTGSEILDETIDYKLAADGTISFQNFSKYTQKRSVRVNVAVNPFEDNPYKVWNHIAHTDSNGNWTESYDLERSYNGKQFVKAIVLGHTIREITYY